MSGMRIRFIEARSFQRFTRGVRVDDLGPGLNVIAGPNEEGKSTLLRAVRAALFERHRAQPMVDEYRPMGHAVEPEVRLGLHLDGMDYEIHKVFSRRVSGRTLLESAAGGRWQNEDAEAELERLLGFTHASRGRSTTALQGPAGLLWVSQGEAFMPVSPTDEHLRLLHGTLDGSITQMLGGSEGDALYGDITGMYEELFDRRGLPRGALRSAQESRSRASDELAGARAALEGFDTKAERLAEKQRRLAQLTDAGSLETARRQRDASRQRLEQVAARRRQVDEATQALELARLQLQQASAAWQVRQALIRDVAATSEALAEADAGVAETVARLDQLAPSLAEARNEARNTRTRLQHAQHQARALQRWRERDRVAEEARRLRERLDNAETMDQQRRALSAEHGSLHVSQALLNDMDELMREADRTRARLKASAARLDFRLEPERTALLDGTTIRDSGSVPVLAPTQVRIDGIGSFTLHPAASAATENSVEELDRRLQELLRQAQVPDPDAARTALQRKQAITHRLEALAAALRMHAPDGLEALRDDAARVSRELDVLNQELGSAPRPDMDSRQPAQSLDSLEASAEAAEQAARALEAEEGAIRQQLAGAQAARAHAGRDQRAREQELETARAASGDDSLASALAREKEGFQRQELELSGLRASLAAEDPEAAALAAAQAEDVYRNRKQELERLRDDCNDLRIELRTLGQQGLAERLAELEATHEQASLRLQFLSRRSQAVKLLHQVMSEALERARRSVSQPIVDRLGPYIATVIPGAAPLMDENLALGGLGRGDMEQHFELLSMGTREQIAVLTRLAYADALAEAGQPVCVLLDDALVNTDDERLERMQAVLFEASQRYQIIILTCHARAYADAGGHMVQLQDCAMDGEAG